MKPVVIIGGGMSGLAAGVKLASKNIPVLVLEQSSRLGGRASSFHDERIDDIIDTGQHLMLGRYHETLDFLKTIDAFENVTIDEKLQIDFLHPKYGRLTFRCPPIPAPFNILFGLMRLKSLSLTERLSVLNLLPDLIYFSKNRQSELEDITVADWFRQRGQSENICERFWNIIVVGTMNDRPDNVSARMFAYVLREVFMKRRNDSCFVLANTGLGAMYTENAAKYIEDHGGCVKKNIRVEELRIKNNSVTKIIGSDDVKIIPSAVISSIPSFALKNIRLSSGETLDDIVFKKESKTLEYQSIVSIDLWFDRPVMEQKYAALLDTHIQWVFNKSKILKNYKGKKQYLSLVISAADSYIGLDQETLVKLALHDFKKVLPAVRDAKLLNSKVIKEKRATVSLKPGAEQLRPDCFTSIKNLFLAGDWTNTGLPSTIEGAVVSGNSAATTVLEQIRMQ